MVRRRTRAKMASVGNGVLLEDHYIASPKRKGCKIENGVLEFDSASNSITLTALPMGEELKLNSKNKPIFAITKDEQGDNLSGIAMEHPHDIRSQARTTEILKVSTGTKNTKLKDDGLIESYSTHSSTQYYTDLHFERVIEEHEDQTFQIPHTALLQPNTSHMQRNLLFGFIDNCTTNNIFLQQPVLKLNIDKTPNQASSIKIKKSIETDPVFSSPPLFTAPTFSVCSNQAISQDSFNYASKPMILPDIDNSSCDSGIAFATHLDNNLSLIETSEGTQIRRRKPATPHRIVCPSPIKAPSRGLTDGGAVISPSCRNITAAKEQLSPRKSQRHVVIAASKTRRRLNHLEDQAPYTPAYNTTNTIPSSCKQDVHLLLANAHSRGQDENLTDIKARNVTMPPSVSDVNKNLQSSAKGQSKSNVNKAQQSKTKNKTSQPLATTNCNRELTEFFPVRRSVRKTKTAVKEEMMKNLEQAILEERAEGLKVAHFEGKGRGIVADRRFQRSEFVVEYEGDLISMSEASEREKRYALDENAGCYMYYFKHKNQQYCIDATVDTGKLGRLVNHSRNGNLMTKVVVVKQRPHLILIARDDIELGEELTYDYGDRSKESLMHHPWLAF